MYLGAIIRHLLSRNTLVLSLSRPWHTARSPGYTIVVVECMAVVHIMLGRLGICRVGEKDQARSFLAVAFRLLELR